LFYYFLARSPGLLDQERENGKENGKNSPQTGIATGMVLTVLYQNPVFPTYGNTWSMDERGYLCTLPSRIQFSCLKARFLYTSTGYIFSILNGIFRLGAIALRPQSLKKHISDEYGIAEAFLEKAK
jgi:hypothetical protein